MHKNSLHYSIFTKDFFLSDSLLKRILFEISEEKIKKKFNFSQFLDITFNKKLIPRFRTGTLWKFPLYWCYGANKSINSDHMRYTSIWIIRTDTTWTIRGNYRPDGWHVYSQPTTLISDCLIRIYNITPETEQKSRTGFSGRISTEKGQAGL